MIRVCYVDEAGCTGVLPTATSAVQPAFVLAAVVFHQNHLPHLTQEFLALKRKFFPALTPNTIPFLQHVRVEIKGSELRKSIRAGDRNQRRHAFGFLDGCVKLLEKYNSKIFCRVWIKGIAHPIDGKAVYTYSIQSACTAFQNLLEFENRDGVMIADSRTPYQNINVSHSIFTQKFKANGDAYGRILEMPTFGHSENHVGLQIADIVCSALIFPIATHTYCAGHITSVHVNPSYAFIKQRYGTRLKELQYRYLDDGRYHGGITVNDQLMQRSSAEMFR